MTRDMMCAVIDAIAPVLVKLVCVPDEYIWSARTRLYELDVVHGGWTTTTLARTSNQIKCMCYMDDGYVVMWVDGMLFRVPAKQFVDDCTRRFDDFVVDMKNNCNFRCDITSGFIPISTTRILCLNGRISLPNSKKRTETASVLIDVHDRTLTVVTKNRFKWGFSHARLRTGEILISYSWFSKGDKTFNAKSSIFRLGINRFCSAPGMRVARLEHASCALPNGRIFVCGGRIKTGSLIISTPTDMCEEYDHATRTWTDVGKMTCKRAGHKCVLLPCGLVKIIGGDERETVAGRYRFIDINATSEFYDPQTRTFEQGYDMNGYPTRFDVVPIYEDD
jgi:hypothetical protein